MQWDSGASRLYDIREFPAYLQTEELMYGIKSAQELVFQDMRLTACITQNLASSLSNDGCLVEYMARPEIGLRRADFFVYLEILNPSGVKIPTQSIAACTVFTGPSKADIVGEEASEEFRQCTETNRQGTSCQLQGYVWSSRSRNAVPVANMHAVGYSNTLERSKHAQVAYEHISNDMVASISRAKSFWGNGSWLKVELFTAEGDWLHQAFDCALLGPYGRAELSPRDLGSTLPALEYFRDRNGGDT
ncbi:hypothetical protein T484DRAFT_1758656, partial [Baffinella frigidus]